MGIRSSRWVLGLAMAVVASLAAAPGGSASPGDPTRAGGTGHASSVPACVVSQDAVRPGGELVWRGYTAGRGTRAFRTGFQWADGTRDLVPAGVRHSPEVTQRRYLRLAADGTLHESWLSTGTGPQAQTRLASSRSLGRGMRAAQLLALVPDAPEDAAAGWLYTRNDRGELHRWRVTGLAGTGVQLRYVARVPGSFASLTTLAPSRRNAASDVLLATTSSGQLLELKVARSSGLLQATRVLRSSGFGGYASVQVGQCVEAGSRAIVGVARDGSARLFHDRDGDDGIGTDIGAGWLLTREWTSRGYDG